MSSSILGRKNIRRVRNLALRGRTPSMNILRLAANVANGETVTINGTVFEFSTDGTVGTGNVEVDVTAAQTPAAASTALVTEINASACGMRAKKISDNEVLVFAANGEDTAYACTETLAGANNVWASATAFGGRAEQDALPVPILISRTPTATEVALQTMHFPLTFTPTIVIPQVRTSAGAIRAFDGTVTITDDYVSIVSGGTTDVAADDVVTLAVW